MLPTKPEKHCLYTVTSLEWTTFSFENFHFHLPETSIIIYIFFPTLAIIGHGHYFFFQDDHFLPCIFGSTGVWGVLWSSTWWYYILIQALYFCKILKFLLEVRTSLPIKKKKKQKKLELVWCCVPGCIFVTASVYIWRWHPCKYILILTLLRLVLSIVYGPHTIKNWSIQTLQKTGLSQLFFDVLLEFLSLFFLA